MAQLNPITTFFRLAPCALLAGVLGCSADSDALGDEAPRNDADAGAQEPTTDGVGTPPFDANDKQGAPLPAGESPDAEYGGANSCFDNTDNDADSAMDCNDEGCRARGTCCVGNSECCAPTAGGTLSIDFTTCTSENIAGCDDSLSLFGDALVDTSGITFGADLTKPGGVISNQALDLRAMQRVVTFSTDARCTPDADTLCAGTSGVSLIRDNPDALGARPDIVVGLQAFATNRRIGLVVENTVISTWDLQSTGPETWALQVSPSGEVRVHGPAGNFETYVNADMDVYAMVFGQGADAPAVTSISIETLVCDTPNAWLEPTALVADDGGTVTNPSIATNAIGETWVAFERERRIYFGQLVGAQIRVATTKDTAFFPDSEFYSAVRVSDPELVWEQDRARWALFFTGYAEDALETRTEARGDNAVGAIARATIAPDTFATISTRLVLAPYGAARTDTLASTWGDTLDFEMPTVTVTQNPTYPWVMVVRARLADGTSVLRAFKSGNGIDWELAGANILEERTQRDASISSFRFDAQNILQPSLLVQNRAYHLYYEGRSAERSSIGLLVSDDLVGWRDMSEDGAVYEEGQNDFDRLGVRAADVLFDGQNVRMLYVGDDGSSQTPALVHRPAPNNASM